MSSNATWCSVISDDDVSSTSACITSNHPTMRHSASCNVMSYRLNKICAQYGWMSLRVASCDAVWRDIISSVLTNLRQRAWLTSGSQRRSHRTSVSPVKKKETRGPPSRRRILNYRNNNVTNNSIISMFSPGVWITLMHFESCQWYYEGMSAPLEGISRSVTPPTVMSPAQTPDKCPRRETLGTRIWGMTTTVSERT